MATRLSKITVYVDSQEEAKRFWTEKVGFGVALEQPMGPGAKWLEVAPPGENPTSMVLYPKDLARQQNFVSTAHPLIIFSTDDLDGFHRTLQDRQVEVTEVQSLPYGRMFNFQDNDGNRYMVRQD